MIYINSMSKAYNSKNVLQNIDLRLEEGRIYGLIGANGSGQSTLIKCICGIYPPDKGEIKMDEDAIFESPKCKEKIGIIFDEIHFLPLYTVNAYANYYASFYNDFSFEKFDGYLKKFGISPKAFAENLSLGNRKKVQIALVLSRNIEYLLMDEPENGLDNESREIFRELIRECADNGMSILFSSHDILNIEKMCDDLIFIDENTIKYNSAVDERLSNIQKWIVKGYKERLEEFMIVEEMGKMFTVLTEGDRESNQKRLEGCGEIIDSLQVTVVDAYKLMRKKDE